MSISAVRSVTSASDFQMRPQASLRVRWRLSGAFARINHASNTRSKFRFTLFAGMSCALPSHLVSSGTRTHAHFSTKQGLQQSSFGAGSRGGSFPSHHAAVQRAVRMTLFFCSSLLSHLPPCSRDHYTRYGLAFLLEHGFMRTPKGRTCSQMNLAR